MRRTIRSIALAALTLSLVAACGAKPMLESKNAAIPAGIDLSGNWTLRNPTNRMRRPGPSSGAEPIISSGITRRGQRPRRPAGDSVEVFLEYGNALKVTQTQFGLFVCYDRSVVEEYTFGENRLVTVGPIEAQRVSGWSGSSFVVETLDSRGTVLYETWSIDRQEDALTRDVRIAKDDRVSFRNRETFDRKK